MERSSSWPDINILSESDYANGSSPEVIIYRLREKLSECEEQKTSLQWQLESLKEEKKNVQIHNLNLIENNRCNLQQILMLESKINHLMLQQEEIENQAAYLRKELEESEREKGKISKDLGMWLQAFENIQQSKKEVEKHIEMLRETNARDRNVIENKAIEEFTYLREQLKAVEHRLKAEQEVAEGSKTLRIENNKLQVKISKLKQQNFTLKLQIDQVEQRFKNEQEQNLKLREEIDEMWKQSCSCVSHESASKQLLKFCAPESGTFTPLTFVNDCPPRSPNPLPVYFSNEIDERLLSLTSKRQEDENQWDPIEEYMQLSITAVKIRFPNVNVSQEQLIEKAKDVPFYYVHDVLSKYMEEKSKRQRKWKNGRDIGQRDSGHYYRQQASVFDKVRGFFGCRALVEHSQRNVEGPRVSKTMRFAM